MRDVGDLAMSDDDETHLHVAYAIYWDMDDAFCSRMRMAIAAAWRMRRLVSSQRLEPNTPNTSQQHSLPTR